MHPWIWGKDSLHFCGDTGADPDEGDEYCLRSKKKCGPVKNTYIGKAKQTMKGKEQGTQTQTLKLTGRSEERHTYSHPCSQILICYRLGFPQ